MFSFPGAAAPTFADPNTQAVHTNASVSASGSVVLSGYGAGSLELIVNITASPTGTLPTLQYTVTEVDPVTLTATVGAAHSSNVFSAIGIQVLTIPTQSGAVKVAWTIGGTGSPTFTGVNASVSAKADVAVGAVGAAAPLTAVQVAGSDGTNLRALATNTSGQLVVAPLTTTDKSGSGTLGALNATLTVPLNGCTTLTCSTTGTWNGTVEVFGQAGDGQWVGPLPILFAYSFQNYSLNQGFNFTSNIVGSVNVGGYTQIQLQMTAYTSGTVTITWNASVAPGTTGAVALLPDQAIAIAGGLTAYGQTFYNNPVCIGGVDGGGLLRSALTDTSGRLVVTQTTATNLKAQVVGPNTLADATANAATAVPAQAFISGYNGTTWDRTRSAGNAADALATVALGVIYVNAFNMGYNGTTWDRLKSSTANGLQVDVTRVQGTVSTKPTTASTPAVTQVAGSASNVVLKVANANRLGLLIYNDSTAILYAKLGTTASSTSYSVQLAPQTSFSIPFGYTGEVDGIWASAAGNAYVTELTA
jgi:hypothetical protein